MRRSVLTQTDMDHHHDEQDEDSDEERSPEEKPLKTGFLNNIKQRFQRRFTGVRSRCRSRMQKSPSQPQGALSTYNGEGAEDGQSPDRNLNNPGEDESNELQSQSISVHLIQLSKYGWYWGPITREQAEEKLSKQPDGSFLVMYTLLL